MATRCNIIIKHGGSVVYLYRHWDGYPACTGADIGEKLIKAEFEKTAFLAAMLAAKRGGDGHDAERAQYELTNGLHGDIEWCYTVQFSSDRDGLAGLRVGWGERRLSADEEVHEAEAKSRLGKTFKHFIEMVNQEIDNTNRRIAELRAKHDVYADCDDFLRVEWQSETVA